MRSNKRWRFWVTGHGQFPDDMLRYDQAVVIREVERNGLRFYEVQSKVAPTVGRWRSFLWSVIETAEQRERFGLPDHAVES